MKIRSLFWVLVSQLVSLHENIIYENLSKKFNKWHNLILLDHLKNDQELLKISRFFCILVAMKIH